MADNENATDPVTEQPPEDSPPAADDAQPAAEQPAGDKPEKKKKKKKRTKKDEENPQPAQENPEDPPPAPEPEPAQETQPEPEPAPEPEKAPTPAPAPEPEPVPEPEAAPAPEPVPEPEDAQPSQPEEQPAEPEQNVEVDPVPVPEEPIDQTQDLSIAVPVGVPMPPADAMDGQKPAPNAPSEKHETAQDRKKQKRAEERKKRLDELLALDGFALRAAAFDYATIGKVYDQLSLVDSFGFLMEPTSRLYGAIETLRDTVKVAKVVKPAADKGDSTEVAQEQEFRPLPKPTNIVNNEKRTVYLRMVILKVGDISTITEVFGGDLFLQSRWREPILDGATPEQLKTVVFSAYWKPQLVMDNIFSEQKDTSTYAAEADSQGQVWMFERRRIKGVFLQQLNLEQYPFDCQDLTVTVTTEESIEKIAFEQDTLEPTIINPRTSVEQQEWIIHEHVDVGGRTIIQEFSNSARERPAFDFTCRASRKPRYFFFNVFIISAFITSLSFGSFSVKNNGVGSIATRLTLTFTLILTSVTFKMVVNMLLPKVSYLTSMDKYLLMGMITIVSISTWHALAAVPLASIVNTIEFYVGFTIGGLYLLMNLIFFLWIFIGVCDKRRSAFRKDRTFKEWLKRNYGDKLQRPTVTVK